MFVVVLFKIVNLIGFILTRVDLTQFFNIHNEMNSQKNNGFVSQLFIK